ncbi:WD40-repeat-containing domain protein [Schizophyllum amplum]|uniref:WD40-repeat-containing domain protein n=1 Tax=Schizophyllum amplum TaxID=97359 RepID=A0A550CN76_9AGAR|nr:WD40-repeat-containing domain protein [Auriculariopsis ampla]
MSSAVARSKLKTSFKKARVVGPIYTGGPVAITQDGTKLVTALSDELLLTDVSSGDEICRFSSDTEEVTSLALTANGAQLAVFSSSLSLRIFDIPKDGETKLVQPSRVVARAHDAPVHVCTIDPTSTYLASGSADGVVKVWDLARGFITHVFKGHGGVVSALTFSLSPAHGMHLFTASVDTRIRMFDLAKHAAKTGGVVKPDALFEGHVSVPRGLDVSPDGRWLISGGRDSVVLVWDLADTLKHLAPVKTKKGKAKENPTTSVLFKTIPILESVEACGLVHSEGGASSSNGGLIFYTAGASGAVKVWDCNSGKVLYSLGMEYNAISDDEEERQQIMQALYVPSQALIISVHADQNILFHSLATRTLVRQLIGYNDEIVDATFLSPRSQTSPDDRDTHVALATNSSLIRLYSASTSDARLLEGHADIVLCLDHSADSRLLVSGSKDRSARIWAPVDADADVRYRCVAVCEGHAESVGAKTTGGHLFMFTGSQDRTIKIDSLVKCRSLTTLKAHDKDINSLDDRTAKVWAIDAIGELRPLGTCKGHKRGVWSVRFGREERVLATGSGDKTVKLWNLDDFSCVKTFEGHTNSVLRVDFLNAGMQMVSSASDGLVKVCGMCGKECMTTLDNHEDKVWALAISSDERKIISGAADFHSHDAHALQGALFMNYLSLHDYRKAIQISLSLSQPGRLLSLFKTVGASAEDRQTSITGSASVDEVLRTLEGARIVQAPPISARLECERQDERCRSARALRHCKATLGGGGGECALVRRPSHGQRRRQHRTQGTRLVQDSYMIDYILGEMDDACSVWDADLDDAMQIDAPMTVMAHA